MKMDNGDIFELLHNGVLKFQGTEKDCRWKLLRSQEMSIQWATTKDGWEIKKHDPNELLFQNEDIKNTHTENA